MKGPIDTTHWRRDLRWRVAMIINGLVAGDHEWGQRRSMLLAVLVVVFTLMGRAVDPPNLYEVCVPGQVLAMLAPTPENFDDPTPAAFCLIDLQQAFPAPFGALIVFVISLGLPHTLRHIFPPLLALYIARRVGANYVRDLLELPDDNTANAFLNAALEGVGYQEARVSAAGFVDADRDSTIAKIGGPGYLKVGVGNAAVVEHYGRPSGAFGHGSHFIHHFEQLRTVIDLRDQYRKVESFTALTKDGIEVQVQNLEVAFRMLMRTRRRLESDQYPFLRSAARQITYDVVVSVDPTGKPTPIHWTVAVPQLVAERVQHYINLTYLDDLVAASNRDPREHIKQAIKEVLESSENRAVLANKGVDLLWVSLGHIVLPEEARTQRITTWQATRQAYAEIELATGEADRLRRMEYVRLLAQLEIIQKMTQGADMTDDISAEKILMHIARALEDTHRQFSPTGSLKPGGSSMREMLMQMGGLEALPSREVTLPPSLSGDTSPMNTLPAQPPTPPAPTEPPPPQPDPREENSDAG